MQIIVVPPLSYGGNGSQTRRIRNRRLLYPFLIPPLHHLPENNKESRRNSKLSIRKPPTANMSRVRSLPIPRMHHYSGPLICLILHLKGRSIHLDPRPEAIHLLNNRERVIHHRRAMRHIQCRAILHKEVHPTRGFLPILAIMVIKAMLQLCPVRQDMPRILCILCTLATMVILPIMPGRHSSQNEMASISL